MQKEKNIAKKKFEITQLHIWNQLDYKKQYNSTPMNIKVITWKK